MRANPEAEQLRKDARQLCLKVAQGSGDAYIDPKVGKNMGGRLIMKQIEQRKMVVMITGPDFQPYLVVVYEELKDYIAVMERHLLLKITRPRRLRRRQSPGSPTASPVLMLQSRGQLGTISSH